MPDTAVERRGRGQPSKINAIHHHDDQGEPVHVSDVILAALRRGDYMETAAALAGVDKTTVYDWLRTGTRAPAHAAKAGRRLTAHERRCVEFSHAVVVATAESEAGEAARIRRAGVESSRKVVTVTKRVPVEARVDGDGEPVIVYAEQIETREELLPPDWRALAWRMERRFSRRWGQRGSLEVSGPEGAAIPIEVRAASIAERLASLRELTPDAETGQEAPVDGDGEYDDLRALLG